LSATHTYGGKTYTARHNQGLGWDGPVEVILPGTVKWYRDAKTLAALIQDTEPVGKSGQLKRDLSLRRGGYKRLPKPRVGFMAKINNAAAYPQDQGADIPERRPQGYLLTNKKGDRILGERAGRAMAWGGPRGGPHTMFAKKAGPFRLRGQNYIERGFDRWIKARGHRDAGIEIDWAPRRGY